MLLEPPTRTKLRTILSRSEPPSVHNNRDCDNDTTDEDDSSIQLRPSNATWSPHDSTSPFSPYVLSPLNHHSQPTLSPLTKSPWNNNNNHNGIGNKNNNFLLQNNGLVGSITREEGHVYSLAVSGDLLYTGSDSKNIRVWKNLKDHTLFKSSSGLVKAIVISNACNRIFTGHQDGKIRIWKVPSHKRVGSMPTFKDHVRSSVSRSGSRRHCDAVSCLSLDEEEGLLYSASWDKTVKVWSVRDFRWLESIKAHSDAVNAVVVGFKGRVFTGSADGTVKMWRRENGGRKVKHVLELVLLEKESAVTALAVNRRDTVVYGGCSDGTVNYWEKRGVWEVGVLRGNNKKVAVLCVGVAGKWVVSGSSDGSVSVWKREGRGVHTWVWFLAGHGGPVKCIAAVEEEGDHEKCMVYSGSVDRSVKVWRVTKNAPELRVCESDVDVRLTTPFSVFTFGGVQEKISDGNESHKFGEACGYVT